MVREKPNAPQGKKDTVENRPYPPVDTRSTPNFPYSERRHFPPSNSKSQDPEFSHRLSSTAFNKLETLNSNGRIQKPTSFDSSGLWESYYAQCEIMD